MGWFNNNNKNTEKRNIEDYSNYPFGYNLSFGNYSNYNSDKAMMLSTVYRCVDVISNAVAQLPIEIYEENNNSRKKVRNELSKILSTSPSKLYTRYTFLKTLVTHLLLNGNAYAKIVRKNGKILELIILNPNDVSIINENSTIKYKVIGEPFNLTSEEVIHLINNSFDGIKGVSTLTYAAGVLGAAQAQETHSTSFFKNGGNLAGLLKSKKPLNKQQKEDLASSWRTAFNSGDGSANGVVAIDADTEYQAITISAKDSLILEARQYSVIEICRFFGVSPVKAFDLSKSNYSNSEIAQLSFLSDTIAPLLEKIELEFERKLLLPSQIEKTHIVFNTTKLLRTDKDALSNYYSRMFQIGVYSIDDIRYDLNMENITNGNKHYVPVNLTDISKDNNTK